MTALVEGFSADALAVAAHLAARGEAVVLAGAGSAPPGAAALRADGVRVVEHADLEAAAIEPAVAYLDVWTPEVAPRVARLRAEGARISSIGDLVLERSTAPVVGVTGTAGKTTTAGLLAHLLAAAGIPVAFSDASPSGNRWPDGRLLERAAGLPADGRLVVELTSSHLAFMTRSPQVAVVTTFWPDHLELHGSAAAYRAAKETIVRHQQPGDRVVVDRSVAEVARFADATPASPAPYASAPGGRDDTALAWLDRDGVALCGADAVVRCALPPAAAYRGPRSVNVAAACAAALASGAAAEAVAEALASAPVPPFRARELGSVRGARVIDDGMAATPAKAGATLAGLGDRSTVLVCGGDDRPAWGAVHASPEERAALDAALDEAARAARVAVVFGPAADRLRHELRRRGAEVVVAEGLDDAVSAAVGRVRGDAALVLAPMFPLAADERSRFAPLVDAAR